jgi:hypothetical protein
MGIEKVLVGMLMLVFHEIGRISVVSGPVGTQDEAFLVNHSPESCPDPDFFLRAID